MVLFCAFFFVVFFLCSCFHSSLFAKDMRLQCKWSVAVSTLPSAFPPRTHNSTICLAKLMYFSIAQGPNRWRKKRRRQANVATRQDYVRIKAAGLLKVQTLVKAKLYRQNEGRRHFTVADLKGFDVQIWVHGCSCTDNEVRLCCIKFSCVLCSLSFL